LPDKWWQDYHHAEFAAAIEGKNKIRNRRLTFAKSTEKERFNFPVIIIYVIDVIIFLFF